MSMNVGWCTITKRCNEVQEYLCSAERAYLVGLNEFAHLVSNSPRYVESDGSAN
jgi:hypothetical protein